MIKIMITTRQAKIVEAIKSNDVLSFVDMQGQERGLNFEFGETGCTPLMYAALLGRAKICEMILKSNEVNRYVWDRTGAENVAHYAVKGNRPEIV